MTETFSYNKIKEEYGVHALKLLKYYEKVCRAKGRYASHLRFYLQCKHNNITPKGLRIKSPLNNRETRNIIEKAQKAILNTRISEVAKKNEILERKKKEIEEDIGRMFPENITRVVKDINEKRLKAELERSTESQKRKYLNLYNESHRIVIVEERIRSQTHADRIDEPTDALENNIQPEETRRDNNQTSEDEGSIPTAEELSSEVNNEGTLPAAEEINEVTLEEDTTIPYEEEIDEDEEVKERWVKNVSDRLLTKHEIDILRKGSGFAVTPREIPEIEYITAIEEASRCLPSGEAMCMKAEALDILKKAKPPKTNLTTEEWKALKALKNDDNIVILPADKGKCIVEPERIHRKDGGET